MKFKTIILKAITILLMGTMFSCQQDILESTHGEIEAHDIPQDVINKLEAAGFNALGNVSKFEDYYVVQGDILFSEEAINNLQPTNGPNEEHHTIQTNQLLSSGLKVIRVFVDQRYFSSFTINAVDEALSRFNALNLRLKFERVGFDPVNPTAKDIILETSNGLLAENALAEWPSNGQPGKLIKLMNSYINDHPADAALTIAHAIGHAIGFRHVDFDDNPLDNTMGAVHVEGTPDYSQPGVDTDYSEQSQSWMYSIDDGNDRPFSAYDKVALDKIYGIRISGNNLLCSSGTYTLENITGFTDQVTWSVSPSYLVQTAFGSGKTPNLVGAGSMFNGEAEITFTVTKSNGDQISGKRTIWVGKPNVSTNPSGIPAIQASLNANVTIQAIVERADLHNYDYDFTWSLAPGSASGLNLTAGNTPSAVAHCMQAGSYTVYVKATNTCGTSVTKHVNINVSTGSTGGGGEGGGPVLPGPGDMQ